MREPAYDAPDHAPPAHLPGAAPYGRPSWSGLLQFSLVGIPLKAYPAVRTRDLPSAHLLHADCGQRLRYAKHCPDHGPLDAAAVVRGYEYGPGRHVLVGPEDLDPLRPAQDHALRLERFLAPEQLDPVLFSGRSLHLLPDGPAAQRGYAVLREALVQRRRWALGRMVLGGHRQLVLVRPAGDLLVAQVLHYPEYVRACPLPALPPPGDAGEESRLAGMLIDAAAGAGEWAAYRDQAAEDLRALLEAKLQGGPPTLEAPAVLPLLEALQKSLAATTGGAGGKGRPSRKRARRSA
jgi:DNA end-binding protein Ku